MPVINFPKGYTPIKVMHIGEIVVDGIEGVRIQGYIFDREPTREELADFIIGQLEYTLDAMKDHHGK